MDNGKQQTSQMIAVRESELVRAWRNLSVAADSTFLLPGDDMLRNWEPVNLRSFDELLEHPEFDFRDSPHLHLGLIPVPYAGDLARADIFILMKNPGFRPVNYFAEFHDPDYRDALLANLAQESLGEYPFFYLAPRFSYTGGYEYWRGKLASVAIKLRQAEGMTLSETLRSLAQRIAVLQLLPYHSSVSGLADSRLRQLASVKAAREFAQTVLLPRAQEGSALIVVARAARLWGLEKRDVEEEGKVIVYSSGEARGAHLGAESRAGLEILKRLRRSR